MNQQPTFWNNSGEIVVDTRAVALASIAGSRQTDQQTVLAFIRDAGAHGSIDEEIEVLAASLGKRESTFRARRVELFRDGLIANAGRTRPSKSGRAAIVWIATGKPLT